MNMAIDQAWLELSEKPILRIYQWDQPTVTLGYAQNLTKLQPSLPPGWPIIRRWTGGGVVLHQADFTYSIIVPAQHPWAQTSALDSYQLIHQSLAEVLTQSKQRPYRLALPEDLVEGPFCFVAPALHDVICGQAKIAGAGQRRGRVGLLHQGSVQQVQLEPSFWPTWAAHLAERVEIHSGPAPELIQDRAQTVVTHRFSLPQWLTDRDDELAR
jgi:lipoyl(octanoyl) transferase